MKLILKTILPITFGAASLAVADSEPSASATDTKKIVQNNFVETAQRGVKLSGYVDAGYSYNFAGTGNQSNINGRFTEDTSQNGDFNLYALKLTLEKAMSTENKAQAGFRADVMIGEDATYLANRTAGNDANTSMDSNSLFLEQAYALIRAPVGNGWDFKVGKFVSILGYEVIERPANMNTTYGLLFNVMPLFYTGLLSSYRFDDYLDGKLGVVNGSNSDNNTTTNPNAGDGVAVLAALNVRAPGGNATWSNNFQYSTGSDNNTSTGVEVESLTTSYLSGPNATQESAYMVIYNSWGSWAPQFADDKLLLAFNALLGNSEGTFSRPAGGSGNVNACWYGAGTCAKYQFNDWFSLSSRAEFLGSNGSRIFGNQGTASTASSISGKHMTGESLWEYTLTAGFHVIDNLLLRAEYRMDWGGTIYRSSDGLATSNGSPSDGPVYYAGAEVVYSF